MNMDPVLILAKLKHRSHRPWFDKPVLSEVEGLTTNGKNVIPFALSNSKGEGGRQASPSSRIKKTLALFAIASLTTLALLSSGCGSSSEPTPLPTPTETPGTPPAPAATPDSETSSGASTSGPDAESELATAVLTPTPTTTASVAIAEVVDASAQESVKALVAELADEAWDFLVTFTEEFSPRESATDEEKTATVTWSGSSRPQASTWSYSRSRSTASQRTFRHCYCKPPSGALFRGHR